MNDDQIFVAAASTGEEQYKAHDEQIPLPKVELSYTEVPFQRFAISSLYSVDNMRSNIKFIATEIWLSSEFFSAN